jgi:predicted nucleic acid-binding protein
MYLVDTNVISESRKGAKANRGVVEFFRASLPGELYLCAQTIGELRRGVENIRGRGDFSQAGQLETWLDRVSADYADRILPFDADCAQVWGRLMSPHASNPIDKQIAAIALIHGLAVVTRNTQDFTATGARVHNPFI